MVPHSLSPLPPKWPNGVTDPTPNQPERKEEKKALSAHFVGHFVC